MARLNSVTSSMMRPPSDLPNRAFTTVSSWRSTFAADPVSWQIPLIGRLASRQFLVCMWHHTRVSTVGTVQAKLISLADQRHACRHTDRGYDSS